MHLNECFSYTTMSAKATDSIDILSPLVVSVRKKLVKGSISKVKNQSNPKIFNISV